MKAEIFPGLKAPTTNLYYDLQAMIAKNGGRLRLANMIEEEWRKGFRTKHQLQNTNRVHKVHYTAHENRFIVENYNKMSAHDIAVKLNRTTRAITQHVLFLREQGCDVVKDVKFFKNAVKVRFTPMKQSAL